MYALVNLCRMFHNVNSVTYNYYHSLAEFCFLAQWWSDIECDLYVDPEDQKYLGKEHTVAVFNHTYEIDWLVAWMMAERHGLFGVNLSYRNDPT